MLGDLLGNRDMVVEHLLDSFMREKLGLEPEEQLSVVWDPDKDRYYIMIKRVAPSFSDERSERYVESLEPRIYHQLASMDSGVVRRAADEFFRAARTAVMIFKVPWRHVRKVLPDVGEAEYFGVI